MVVAVRGSCGQAEIWSAGSKHQFTALKAAPSVRLLDGVEPAKGQRRQRTARAHPDSTPAPGTGGSGARVPARIATRAAADPGPIRRVSPAQIFTPHGVRKATRDCW